MRQCVEVEVRGLRLKGVMHLPRTVKSPNANPKGQGSEVGVLMLHPGFLPRSGVGDAVVALADGLAAKGIMTIRMDLPGLGDSEGDLAETAVDFIGALQEGEFAEQAWDCIRAVQAKLGLERVVVGGYCGGAITGLFMANSHKHELPAGLFALETSFKLVTSAEPTAARAREASPAERRRAKIQKFKTEVEWVLGANVLGRALLAAYRVPRRLFRPRRASSGAAAGRPQPPAETNFKLMHAVDSLLKTQIPLLFVSAEEANKQAGFDFVDYALTDYPGRAVHRKIQNTDHSLADGEGPARVLEYVAAWIESEFGLPAKVPKDAGLALQRS
jgi:pimeloyl-ACP methyl ester carboxylesterase